MKKQINAILKSTMVFFIFYLVGCFIEVSFDISKWNTFTRVIVSVGGAFYSTLAYLFKKDSI